MRTDCIIDGKQIRCPNASLIGFGRSSARVGDLVVYTTNGHRHIARMIGRVKYAPNLDEDRRAPYKPIRGHILGVVLGERLTSVSERWIDPMHVVEVYRMADINALEVVTAFLSDDLAVSAKRDVGEVRRALFEHGWSTLAGYRAWKVRIDADIRDMESRKSESEPDPNLVQMYMESE